MFARLRLCNDGSLLAELQVRPTWTDQIKGKQLLDDLLVPCFREVEKGETVDFGLNSEGVLCFRGRVYMPRDHDLRQSILREAHNSLYAMHLGENKLYRDLRELYWWPGLKREVTEYMSKCLTCQQVKAEHQLPSGLLQQVKIPLWKWERTKILVSHPSYERSYMSLWVQDWITVRRFTLRRMGSLKGGSWEDYLSLAKFAYSNNYQSSIQMAPYEALYGRRCRTPTCWTELGERRILGPELISDTEDKVKLIRDRLKQASDRQKSYAYQKRKEIEYAVGDYVFLKVSPWKKILKFG
ncbi:uncharacterized protein LOC108466135 [Gossypium arboreum]|uniref:uncharacterized protein LOC108466135 n=1 Tax=Gossypium arboreum TaxID=29729 RepID=UPI0008196522|nr:uncharacterized protein LOC108466135 [Gossypium arboreum]